jgi:hypothetical protein
LEGTRRNTPITFKTGVSVGSDVIHGNSTRIKFYRHFTRIKTGCQAFWAAVLATFSITGVSGSSNSLQSRAFPSNPYNRLPGGG